MSEAPLSFDLVVATLGRDADLARFVDSVEAQDYDAVRVLVVDQNDDDRVERIVAGRAIETVVLRSAPGLSRARNAALAELDADLVAFPDDDCVYPPGLLRDVAARFADDATLDGLTGRAEDAAGRSSASWKQDSATLTDDNLWNRANAATMFLRQSLVRAVGPFDERLGLGSGKAWSSGEETDYLIRAVRIGARIAYDPALVVQHDVRADTNGVGLRDGASVGYLLGKHRYPPRVVGRMFVRPVGGAVQSLLRLDLDRSAYYAATEVGRARGYLAARFSKSAS